MKISTETDQFTRNEHKAQDLGQSGPGSVQTWFFLDQVQFDLVQSGPGSILTWFNVDLVQFRPDSVWI